MAVRRINVLFAIPELDQGGPERVIFELARHLDRSKFAPSMMTSSERGHYLSKLPSDIPVEVLGDRGGFRDRYPVVRALRFIRASAPDVVLATQRMILTLGVVPSRLRGNTRLILRQANDVTADFEALIAQSPLKHRLARWMTLANLRHADAVVCQSTAMQKDLRQLLGGDTPLHVISNPVDVDAIARAAAADDRKLPGAPSLISVGRLAPQKGYDVLLAAIARLRSRYPRMHLTIVGDGPDRASLEQLVSEHGIGEAVSFAGFERAPLPLVRSADLFVLASRYEGFPNAALESLACGTPIVLTDCPGANAEIVKPGINGRLAAAVEPEAMADAIDLALRELATYDRSRIIADCHARFASQSIVRAYEQVLMSVVRGTDNAAPPSSYAAI